MKLNRRRAYLMGFFLWVLFLPTAQALSLGEITVNSALNDPLDAEIRVYSTDAAEILNTRTRLASREIHNKAGLSMNQHHHNLQFKTIVKKNGQFAIKVTTTRPVSEPVLEFIIEVTGSNSNLIRGYALHLDPPNL